MAKSMCVRGWTLVSGAILCAFALASCGGDSREACEVTTADSGAVTIACPGSAPVTIPPPGEPSSCAATDNGDGTYTIDCGAGGTITVSDGADGADGDAGASSSCGIEYRDGVAWVVCEDGTEASLGVRRYPSLILGGATACALTREGVVRCWGEDADSPTPLGTNRYASLIGDRNNSTFCAMTSRGRVDCWGRNDTGQLNVPDATFRTVEVLGQHTLCGLTTTDEVTCWPSTPATLPLMGTDRYVASDFGDLGELCFIEETSRMVTCRPAVVPPPPAPDLPTARYTDVATSNFGESVTVYAITEEGVLHRDPPAGPAVIVDGSWKSISALANGICGIHTDGTLECVDTNTLIPVPPAGDDFVDIEASNTVACAVRESGAIVCWGLVDFGITNVPNDLR